MQNDNGNSAVNTLLLVVLVVIAILGLVWFAGALPNSGSKDDGNTQIDVTLPTPPTPGDGGGDAGGDTQTQ